MNDFIRNSNDATFLSLTKLLAGILYNAKEDGYPIKKINAFKKRWLSLWKNEHLKNIASFALGMDIVLSKEEVAFYTEFFFYDAVEKPRKKLKRPKRTLEFWDNYFKTYRKKF